MGGRAFEVRFASQELTAGENLPAHTPPWADPVTGRLYRGAGPGRVPVPVGRTERAAAAGEPVRLVVVYGVTA